VRFSAPIAVVPMTDSIPSARNSGWPATSAGIEASASSAAIVSGIAKPA